MHGTRKAYRAGCRCVACRAANAARTSRDRRRRLRASGPAGELRRAADGVQRAIEARRRVRQLLREGYTASRIAELAGWKDRKGYHVLFRRGQSIRLETYERILRVARFAMLEGVECSGSTEWQTQSPTGSSGR